MFASYAGGGGYFVASALILSFLCASTCCATWSNDPVGEYQVYYWDNNPKFRYQSSIGQWEHYSTVGGTWYTLSATGLSDQFIGDGAWYNLGTGLRYRYDENSNFGFYQKGGAYRFYYRYAPGQWYNSGCGGGWYVLGAAGRSAAVLGDGNWHDLGIGLNYQYNVTNDFGYYKRGAYNRFYYRYIPGQWYTSGYGGGWYLLGAAGRSAAVLGDGNWYDLGIGLNYQYNVTNDFGFYKRGAAYRFYYRYAPGQWYNSGYGGGWYLLGAAGRSAAVISDGNWYDLGIGLNYQYNVTNDFGFYKWGAAYRFYYRYTPGQWYNSGYGGGWYAFGPESKNATILCDGISHDLQEGLKYRYDAATDRGFYYHDSSYRFYYDYVTGQWWNTADYGGGWYVLGTNHKNAMVIVNGGLYDLGNGFTYKYAADRGTFSLTAGGAIRFAYDYASGFWLHGTTDEASLSLLGQGLGAFIGDGNPHTVDLVPNTWSYSYAGGSTDTGYWRRADLGGDNLRFKYRYAAREWHHHGQFGEELLEGNVDPIWDPTHTMWPMGLSINSGPHAGWSYGYDYGNDRAVWRDDPMGSTLSYGYGSGQWYHGASDPVLDVAYAMGNPGQPLTVFYGDGAYHPFDALFSYKYVKAEDCSIWALDGGSAERFKYSYDPMGGGTWHFWQANAAWQALLRPINVMPGDWFFLGDGIRHDCDLVWFAMATALYKRDSDELRIIGNNETSDSTFNYLAYSFSSVNWYDSYTWTDSSQHTRVLQDYWLGVNAPAPVGFVHTDGLRSMQYFLDGLGHRTAEYCYPNTATLVSKFDYELLQWYSFVGGMWVPWGTAPQESDLHRP